jgi:hypothetical protein
LIINFISGILTIYIWGTVCVALYFLFAIARFYEEKSGRRSYYSLFLVPIGLFAIAAIKYSLLAPLISGDFWGDLLRFIGGVTLMGSGYFLLRLMIGGRS